MSEKTLGELFFDACKNGEEAKVNAVIVLGPLNLATTQGKESNGRLTPLNLATYYGKDSKLLLENDQFRIFMGWVRADYRLWINDPL